MKRVIDKLEIGNIIQAEGYGCILIVLAQTPSGLYQCYGMGQGYINIKPKDVRACAPKLLGEIHLDSVKCSA